MARNAKSLKQQMEEVLEKAAESGVRTNFFFQTTFKRYVFQMKVMEELEKQINDGGMLVTKEYVKGRQNVYTNPAIAEYNKTASAANGTVTTLINIVKAFEGEDDGGQSKLTQFMRGMDEDGEQ